MRFPIVQCLCGPQRHAILAMAVSTNLAEQTTDHEALAWLKAAIGLLLEGRGGEIEMPPRIDPWCGLCGAPARDWTYEIGWSREFEDWGAAQRALRESETDQRASAALLELLDVTYNARMRGEVARHVDDAHGTGKPR
ncbi:MAG: hypothetical protein ABJA98_01615 [Acidobacteriota bacterium]